jgi:hypothetical protein
MWLQGQPPKKTHGLLGLQFSYIGGYNYFNWEVNALGDEVQLH